MANPAPKPATILAVDYGLKRLGLAVGDAVLKVTHPVATVTGSGKEQQITALKPYIKEWQPTALVVGLPLQLDDTEGDIARRCRNFAAAAAYRFNLPVYLVDERYSSVYAEILLNEGEIRGRRQKKYLDQVAAQAILSSFFSDGFLSKIDSPPAAGSET